MKTIALITTRFVRQGPNKQLLYLIRNIDKSKINLIIITLSREREPSLINEFRKEDIEIIQLNLSFFKSLFKTRRLLNNLIFHKNIDIIHSFTYARRVEFLIYNIKNVVKIATIRNSPKQSKSGYFGGIGGQIVCFFQLKAYYSFQQIVACSESIFKLPELISYNKVTIQNGIDIGILSNNLIPNNKHLIRKILKLPKNGTIYITISNGTSIKNIEFLILYFKSRKNKLLIIAGDTKEVYNRLAEVSENIIFIGHVENIYKYYQAADIFISASFTEGLPNAVLESLLLGTPCILSNISMHQEIIEKSKNLIGLIFENNNELDLSNKIELLEKSMNESTKFNCSQFIIRNFSAKKMAKQYEKLYLSKI